MSASSVAKKINAGHAVRLATKGRTAAPPKASATTTKRSSATTPATRRSTSSGRVSGKSVRDAGAPTSKPLVAPLHGSKQRWPVPKSVREFANQVNAMATAVLNGEITGEALDVTRIYAGLARTVAQLMTTEVQRARMADATPDLSFDTPDEDERP